MQYRFVRPGDRATTWLEDRGSVGLDSSGEVEKMTGVMVDGKEFVEIFDKLSRRLRLVILDKPNLFTPSISNTGSALTNEVALSSLVQ